MDPIKIQSRNLARARLWIDEGSFGSIEEARLDKVLVPYHKVLVPYHKVLVPYHKVLVPYHKVLVPYYGT